MLDKQTISKILIKWGMSTRQVAINEILKLHKKDLDEARAEARENLLKDMKLKMFNWHGRGNAMIDDYIKLSQKKS